MVIILDESYGNYEKVRKVLLMTLICGIVIKKEDMVFGRDPKPNQIKETT